jgi:phosphate:Na+ symporter
VAYIAFKLIAAAVALVLFSVVVRLMVRASETVDPVTLVAAYHTAYNVVGVAILLPLVGPFTRVIERIVPDRRSAFAGYLDPAALTGAPTVAVEAARRTVAHVLETSCASTSSPGDGAVVRQASEALHQVQDFLSKVTEALPSEDERQWFIGTLHALDHVRRLAESIEESAKLGASLDSPDERRAVDLYTDAMRSTAESAVLLEHVTVEHTAVAARDGDRPAEIIERLARCSKELAELRIKHRRTTLDSVAAGKLTTSDAIANVEAVRLLDQRAHHAWRATAHLDGIVT